MVRWTPGAVVDRDQQRKADGERLRNKKRLREKQRQSQRDAEAQGAGLGPRHGPGGRADEAGPGTKRRNRAGRERDLATWRRVQAQVISHITPPAPGLPLPSQTGRGRCSNRMAFKM
ncbi:hypothetical protein AAFF_G00382910 [Aldrovandia affinis]|uniref:Uncharacterized protein n=1 Tax=Aldrovandia affinis TaxID=143900 RepID=A0AAD7T8A6_9TELE|nr:hypothetical protein AAFF_G00382910 [Aldrovandia affinis]